MDTMWIGAPHDRPRCRAADENGPRCRRPVVWDEATSRPVSTRCAAHGGLDDAAFMGRRSPVVKEPTDKMGPMAGAMNVLATFRKKRRAIESGRRPGGLLTLVLAGAFCLSMTGSALADFEAAVAAYEQGDYLAAQEVFRELAEAGDERAEPYLESIRQKLKAEAEPERSVTSTVTGALRSIFHSPDRPRREQVTEGAATGDGPSAERRQTQSASGGQPSGWEPWSPTDPGAKADAPAPPPESDVVVPQRESVWSTLYHLPGDATVIGLQYVASFLEADNLRRELQYISRHRDEIALSILAGFWWLVIIRGVIGIGVGISRLMKAATTIGEGRRYG